MILLPSWPLYLATEPDAGDWPNTLPLSASRIARQAMSGTG